MKRWDTGDPQRQVLTNDQCKFYARNGYLILLDALAVDQVSALLDEAHRLIAGISKSGEGYPQYDASGGELAAPSPVGRVLARYETANGTAFESTDAPIARLGCSIHQNLPAFLTITHSAFHRSIAKALDCAVPLVTQSQLITKPARVGSRINPHQDGCSSFTYPPSAVTFWYALEDASINNGCLLVAPGSHLTEPLRQRLAKSPQDGRPEFIQLRKPAWATNAVDSGFELHHAREYEYVPLEVTRGTLILCHGNLMHASGANRSERGRVAYVFTIIDGRFHCPDDAYLRPTTGGFLKL
ncbi:MAG: hypothetical protein LQ339_007081 [Xanthoria mediterranea]|nr:MAG: hypothetical protein LQ339_007081 [Xanthoria mediterranea]